MHSLRHFVRSSVRYTRRISNATTLRQEAAVAASTTTVTPLQTPAPDAPNKPLSPKIEQLVSSITNLNLLEVSELSQALKKRLNLPDAPVMAMGAMPSFGAAPAEEEEAAPKTVKTSFTVKLEKYDEKQKIALIKELKNLMEGMNLVQAKKFVESAPAVIKADIGKDEAEKLKDALTKVGAECSID
ncbi:hypothetical protein R5R35_003388 [Gryllus longicercus]|uniref:Mitochondrial ribosomal protein L12 n=1 Tax=Gryllus longicercus TaxID=2509291 RepID=A0AAN9VTQ1_9ORTH